jgi:hypothetical protein
MRESSGESRVRPVSIGWGLRACEALLRQLQESRIITVMRLGTHQGARPRLTYGRSSEKHRCLQNISSQ